MIQKKIQGVKVYSATAGAGAGAGAGAAGGGVAEVGAVLAGWGCKNIAHVRCTFKNKYKLLIFVLYTS